MKEQIREKDLTELFLQRTLGNEEVCRRLITTNRNRATETMIREIEQDLGDFSLQDKARLVKHLFSTMADTGGSSEVQNRRDGAIELLKLVDLEGVDKRQIFKAYLTTVSALDGNSDPLGEIDALLKGGEMIVPFMPTYRQKVATAWNKAASSFPTEKDQKAYLDILKRVQEMECNIPPQLSNFEERVAQLATSGLSNSQIQTALSASPREVLNTIARLTRRKLIEPRPAGRPPHERRA